MSHNPNKLSKFWQELVVTVRMKYWEHQELTTMANKLDKSISDVCRMFMTQGINQINQAIDDGGFNLCGGYITDD